MLGEHVDARLPMMERKVTVAGLIEGLGYEVIRVEVAPCGLDIAVGDPVIHDRLAGTSLSAADVVLAVGVDPRGPELLDLLDEAGRVGAAAVIAKLVEGPELDAVSAAATRAGVALLRLARDVEWGQFHALVRMVTATGGAHRDGEIPLGDLFALANAIAVRARGSVTIEDAQSRVLAYSTGDDEIDDYRRDTILGRRVPESWVRRLQNDGVFQRIWHGEGPVRISYSSSEPGYRDRLVIAVRAGGEAVGSIWIQEGGVSLDDEHEHLLREVAPLAALHLARHLAGDLERRQEAELLKAVLAGRMPPASLSTHITLRPGQRVAVVGLRPVCSDEVEATMHLGRLSSVISLFRRSEHLQLAQTWTTDTLHVVVAAGDRLDAILTELADRARTSVKVPVKVALSHSTSGLDTVVDARLLVDDVLTVCGAEPGRLTEFADVLGAVSLLRWRRAAVAEPNLRTGRIEVLVDSDRDRDTHYVSTLSAFLDRFGDVIAASADLGVHPNTFRYRLRRALDTAGLDIDDPVERSMAHLQLQLLDPNDGTGR
jgi:DNA-binding PucR family transcriptional regulator